VLSDATGRQHFIDPAGKRDWNAFFDAAGDDPLIEGPARLLALLDKSIMITLLTGRPIRVRRLTVDWLARNEIRWDLLVMRPYGDYGKSTEFKRRVVDELRERGYEAQLAFEDEARNRDMFTEAGVPCIYIHSGYYE
jgi:hypothetical protein